MYAPWLKINVVFFKAWVTGKMENVMASNQINTEKVEKTRKKILPASYIGNSN